MEKKTTATVITKVTIWGNIHYLSCPFREECVRLSYTAQHSRQECIDTTSHIIQSLGMYRYGKPYNTAARNV